MQNVRILVLNKVWYPIGSTNIVKTFKLLCKERAEILEYYADTISTPNEEFLIPAVIRLVHYDKIPKAKVSYSKRALLDRDNFKCQYCDKALTVNNATIDHVLPRSHGGQTTFENTVISCHYCNNKKGNKLLGQSSLELKRKPVRPNKLSFRPRFGSLNEEWLDYIPKGMTK